MSFWDSHIQPGHCMLGLVFLCVGVFTREERRRRQLPTTKLRTWVLVCLVGSLVSSPPLSRLHQRTAKWSGEKENASRKGNGFAPAGNGFFLPLHILASPSDVVFLLAQTTRSQKENIWRKGEAHYASQNVDEKRKARLALLMQIFLRASLPSIFSHQCLAGTTVKESLLV